MRSSFSYTISSLLQTFAHATAARLQHSVATTQFIFGREQNAIFIDIDLQMKTWK